MFVSPDFVGRLVVNIHQDIHNSPNSILESKIENIVGVIKNEIFNNPIEVVANSLIKPIFELRCSVIEWASKEKIEFSKYLEAVQEQIVKNIQYKSIPTLNKTLSDVFELSHIITNDICQSVNLSNFGQIGELGSESSLSDKIVASLYSSPNPAYSKKWVDESLKLEFALILADLILTGEIAFNSFRITNELIPFLKQTIIRYGAYAIFIKLWYPQDDDDDGNYLNSMRILAATIAMENKVSVSSATKEDLYQLLQK